MTTSGKQQAIHWVRYRIQNVRHGQQLKMLNLPAPDAAPPAKTKEVVVTLPDPTDLHAGTPPAKDIVLDLPDPQTLPPVNQLAVRMLQIAAEIEHALLVQYLYAAYSLNGNQKVITNIAIEEMSHLMTVQNLLLLLGQPPHLHRQDFNTDAGDEKRLYPFPLKLEPLSKQSLAKYVLAEAPESAGEQESEVMKSVRAAVGQEQIINRVGLLYAFLGVVFGDEQTLKNRSADGDDWYQMIHRLATILAHIYGGRDKIHLPDSAFPNPNPHAARQGTDEEWDRSTGVVPAPDEFRVFPQTATAPLIHRRDALDALRDIGIQGEGASMPGQTNTEEPHFKRFLKEYQRLFGADGSGNDPVPTHTVPSGAVIQIGGTLPGAITHPETMKWAQLANLRYALLLGFLEQYLLSAPTDRAALAPWVFGEMFYLKSLASQLVRLDRTGTPADGKAAVPFTLPAEAEIGMAGTASPWPPIHAERLDRATKLAQEIVNSLPTIPANSRKIELLKAMLESDGRKLAEAEKRRTGGTIRTKFDRVREILDLATGTSSPPHKRFWNVPLAQFKNLDVYGEQLIETNGQDRGARSALVKALKGEDPFDGSVYERMPMYRTPVSNADIAFIKQWIDDGCPDAPLSPPADQQNLPPSPSSPNP